VPLFAIMRTRPNIQKLEKIVKVRKAWNDPMQKTKTHVGLWYQKNKKKTKEKKKKKTKKILLDFKLSPFPECCMLSFGWLPGVWILYADVSEHSVLYPA